MSTPGLQTSLAGEKLKEAQVAVTGGVAGAVSPPSLAHSGGRDLL